MLDITLFSRGSLKITERCHVHSWVRDTVDLLQFGAEQAGLSLTHEIEDAVVRL